jgi:truncated hemoglobin YjbI
MSMLVNDDGSVRIYVAIDTLAKTVVAAYNTVQQADKGVKALQKEGVQNLHFHNITHTKCPEWLQDFAKSDAEYCLSRVATFEKIAARLRKDAEELVNQAETRERSAAKWRELAEAAAAAPAPTM